MKEVPCYACGSTAAAPYASENGFRLVKCVRCGLLFVNPRPDDRDIEAAHRLGVHRGARSLEVTGAFSCYKADGYRRVLSDLFDDGLSLAGKSWLDIGCGHGEFLLALREFTGGTIAARGIEPNERKLEAARRRGLDVGYFDLERHEGRYDVISLLDVYSHLPDPPAALRSWRRLVKPGGEFVLETGDTAHLSSADHYRPFYLPDHLSFASERIVTDILERTGFRIVRVRKHPYITLGVLPLAREVVKLVLPRRRSRLSAMLKHRRYGATDMYVRARLAG